VVGHATLKLMRRLFVPTPRNGPCTQGIFALGGNCTNGILERASLIQENRPVAGVCTLSELDEKLRQMGLLMEENEGGQCTPDDAAVLAQHEGLIPHICGSGDPGFCLKSGERWELC